MRDGKARRDLRNSLAYAGRRVKLPQYMPAISFGERNIDRGRFAGLHRHRLLGLLQLLAPGNQSIFAGRDSFDGEVDTMAGQLSFEINSFYGSKSVNLSKAFQ